GLKLIMNFSEVDESVVNDKVTKIYSLIARVTVNFASRFGGLETLYAYKKIIFLYVKEMLL
ncbi:MAG: hypothetical protein RR583_05385, partial [Enterococcus sp.]